MVSGIGLLSWDKTIGASIDFRYPESLNLSKNLINQICLSHTLKYTKSMELLEFDFGEQLILSYCDKSKVSKLVYDIMILIIPKREKINIFSIKSKFSDFAQFAFKQTEKPISNYISENIEIFFKKPIEKKILILGRAGSGKSSLKKVIFEGKNPKDLIFNPLEPTRGITPSVYSWLDLNLGFFDTSGQELNNLLKDERELRFAFENASILIYLFDYPTWMGQKLEIIEEIKKILKIIEIKSYDVEIILFFHKIDLLYEYVKEPDQLISKIKKLIENEFNLQLFFTSIYPNYLYSTHNAFCEILCMLSPESTFLKNILEEKIKDFPNTMAFITNKHHSIVAQSISKDFNFRIINHIHNLTAQFNQSFLDMVENDNINYFLMSSYKGFTVIMKHLNLPEFDITKMICVSKTLSNERIVDLAHQLGIFIEKIQTKF